MDVYGLVGNPVGHSLSPPMHEAAYEALGMDARYVTFEADPDRIETAIEGAAALGVAGLNVTIPFKESVLDLVEPDTTATRIGAVNTLDFSTDPPRGYNTDAAGARRALAHHDVDVGGTRALLLGAGGAARAIAVMLAEAGAEIHVANRTRSRAESLAEDVDGEAHGLDEVEPVMRSADLLVNATSVGMETDESPVPASVLHEDLVVMDAVYAPLETRLLRDAAAAGARTIDGAWMLLYQGVEAFERWTGRDPPVEAMNTALRSSLE
jgi:shikimate dehydrogenase